MNNILSLLGLANKAGKLEIGEEPTGAAARAGQAKLVLIAADAADNTVRRARHFAQSGGAAAIGIPFTKEELGGVVGRNSCAMLALTDAGLAAAFLKKLAAEQPEKYGEVLARMEEQAQKTQLRRRETLAHTKNIRTGKKHKPRASGGGAPR